MSSRQSKDKETAEKAGPKDPSPSIAETVRKMNEGSTSELARRAYEDALNATWAIRPSSLPSWDDLSTLVIKPLGYRPLQPSSRKEEELVDEIARLRKQLAEQTAAALAEQKKSGQAEKELKEARASQETLQAKARLNFLLNRIHPDARSVLLNSAELQKRFLDSTTCAAYVMSIDIRRSTDLMLKTRRPELFAEFISVLCGGLRDIILANNGVFDKFTGDGILAFFPEFYSGPDAGYSVVAAADAAHALFKLHYEANRRCFVSIIKDVGLGIGIDHGTVNLVQVGDGLTVVGTPVVYACRMGAAPAGTTLLNQPAYEQIFEHFSEACTFREAELEVKHEGRHLAYSVHLNGKTHENKPAAWRAFEKGAA